MKQRIKYIQRFEHFGFPKLAVSRPIVEIGNYSVRNFLNLKIFEIINYAEHLWERNLRPLGIGQRGNLHVEWAERSLQQRSKIYFK